jgi:hypothetical protein
VRLKTIARAREREENAAPSLQTLRSPLADRARRPPCSCLPPPDADDGLMALDAAAAESAAPAPSLRE